MTDLAGHMINERYRFDAHLGEGSFSKVYRVHDMRRNVDLAAKVLKAEIAETPESLARFRREGEVLARLQHPNIVRYYDLVETDDLVFILMDYIPGQTLQLMMHRLGRPMTVNEVFGYLKPLTAALHFAHGEGIIHRDLKPGNILIHENKSLLVTDFGIAQILDDAGNVVTNTNFGTPLYMAPEQILNDTISPATDIYGLGVILFQMLTGSVPFAGNSSTAIGSTPSQRVAYEHLHIEAPFPRNFEPSIPIAVEEVVLHCLAKQPYRRPASVRDVYNELAEAVGADPSDLTPLPPIVEQDRPDITLPEISQFVKLTPIEENNDKTQETSGTPSIEMQEDETAEAIFPKEVIDGQPNTQEHAYYKRVPQFLPPDEVSIASPTPPGIEIPKTPTQQNKVATGSMVLPRRRQRGTFATVMMVSGVLLVLLSCVALSAYMGDVIGGSDNTPSAGLDGIPTITPEERNTASLAVILPTPTSTLSQPATGLPTNTQTNTSNISDGFIVYASHRAGNLDLYITDPDGTLESRYPLTTDENLNETGPSVSPDGEQIAFYGYPINSDDADIYIMNSDGTGVQNLTDSPDEDDRYVSWSPNGEYLVFHSNRREGRSDDPRDYEIYTYALETGAIKQLTDNVVNDFGPDWSPNGQQIAYYSFEDGWHLYVMDVSTQESIRLTSGDIEARFPTWSPDGTQLVFHVTNGDFSQIYICNSDGSDVRPLMTNPGNDAFPDWSPDGTQVIFQRRLESGTVGLLRYHIEDGTLTEIGNPLNDFFPEWSAVFIP